MNKIQKYPNGLCKVDTGSMENLQPHTKQYWVSWIFMF